MKLPWHSPWGNTNRNNKGYWRDGILDSVCGCLSQQGDKLCLRKSWRQQDKRLLGEKRSNIWEILRAWTARHLCVAWNPDQGDIKKKTCYPQFLPMEIKTKTVEQIGPYHAVEMRQEICRAPLKQSLAHCHSVVSFETGKFTEPCVDHMNLQHEPQFTGSIEGNIRMLSKRIIKNIPIFIWLCQWQTSIAHEKRKIKGDLKYIC